MEKAALLKLLGKRIKAIREQKGVTQQELAALCNFEKSNLSRIEAGRSNVTIHTLNKIATSLKVSISDLVNL